MAELRIVPVTGIGEVRPGDDLAEMIAGVAPWLEDGDVLVVTSKIVSKSEGRLVELPPAGPARDAARERVIASETARVVATRGPTRIVQTRHGLVLASAGVDASNVDPSWLVLLPVDPDASARALRAELRERRGVDVAVIVTDTMGRPWRLGLVDVAIGVAGLDPLLDHRGQRDAYGNELHVTITAVADQLAAAAELAKGKLDGVPVAVVRGWPLVSATDGPGARALVRSPELDMFRLGTAEARAEGHAAGLAEGHAAGLAAGMLAAAGPDDAVAFGDAPVDPEAVDRAFATAVRALAGSGALHRLYGVAGGRHPGGQQPGDHRAGDVDGSWTGVQPVTRAAETGAPLPQRTAEIVVATVGAPGDLQAAVAVGAAVQRLRAALAAEGLAAAWIPAVPGGTPGSVAGGPGAIAGAPGSVAGIAIPPGHVPLGLLAIGAPASGTPNPSVPRTDPEGADGSAVTCVR